MSAAAVKQSAEFFENAENYGLITLLPNGGVVDVCVDPRVRTGLSYTRGMVVAQTAGGLAGRGMDGALLVGAEGYEPVTVDSGIAFARSWWPEDDALVHQGCKNNLHAVGILDEMADPSAPTRATMERWAHRLDLPVGGGDTARVQRAATNLAGILRGTTIEYLAESESGHPVYGVEGQNTSGVYVASLASGVGLRHDNRPDGAEGAQVQGYVDTLAHSVDRAYDVRSGLNSTQRHLLAVSTLARAAATRTLLMGAHSNDGHFFETVPSDSGLVRVERVGFE